MCPFDWPGKKGPKQRVLTGVEAGPVVALGSWLACYIPYTYLIDAIWMGRSFVMAEVDEWFEFEQA